MTTALDVIDPAGAATRPTVTLVNPTNPDATVTYPLVIDMQSISYLSRAKRPINKVRREVGRLFSTQQIIAEEIQAHAEAQGLTWDPSMLATHVVPFGEESDRLVQALEAQDGVDTDSLVFDLVYAGLNSRQRKHEVSHQMLLDMLPTYLIGSVTEPALTAFTISQARPEDLAKVGESKAPESGAPGAPVEAPQPSETPQPMTTSGDTTSI